MADLTSYPQVGNKAFAFLLSKLLKHDIKAIGPSEIVTLDDYVLLDTRSKEEYKVSHISGAIWIGYEKFDNQKVKDIPRDAKIITYCSVGYRSEIIARKLVAAGFSQVHNLYGGIFEWVNTGGSLHNQEGLSIDRLHTYNRLWGIWVNTDNKVY